jgi:hypothetical protein
VKVSPPPAPPKQAKQFPPLAKKGKIKVNVRWGRDKPTAEVKIDAPDGIIAHMTIECGWNVRDSHFVYVTSAPFNKQYFAANPHSGICSRARECCENAVDLETDSFFFSA